MDVVYHLLVILVGLVGLFRGWHLGLTGQVSTLLGVGFGAVCAYVFSRQAEDAVRELLPFLTERPGGAYVCAYLGGTAVFGAVYTAFLLLTGVLRNVMEGFGEGTANSIIGCAFCFFRYLLLLGIVYDLLLCLTPGATLRHCVMSDDGNVVQGVMYLAPVGVGCESLDEYIHQLELHRARHISGLPHSGSNHRAEHDVIITATTEPLIHIV